MTTMQLENLKFSVGDKDVIVGTNMAVYLSQQISYFLMQEFGVRCNYKVIEEKAEAKENETVDKKP